MERCMSDRLTALTVGIVLAGLFLIFLAHFGKFVYGETWPIIAPLVISKPPVP